MDTLSQSDDEMKRRLGEMTRKYTVMRINEKMMLRKYAIVNETEEQARRVSPLPFRLRKTVQRPF